jgi:hypothetical protein
MLGALISPKYRLPLELIFAVLVIAGLSMLLTGKQPDGRTGDTTRIRDMKEISVRIDGHWRAYGALPPLLTLLSGTTTDGFTVPVDRRADLPVVRDVCGVI